MNTVLIPEILLPDNCDMNKWAVNACDQYTSDCSYWRDVEKLTEGYPSTYNLIFPEIYLKDEPRKRISRINQTMREYLLNGVFKRVEGGFILVERTTASGTRKGLVIAVDLEDYSFNPQDKALIRSTEATILERIPPRVEIRKNAPIELPHVMLLYNDENDAVLKSIKKGEVLYDFDLMKNGGHVKGTYVKNAEEVKEKFYSLLHGGLCSRNGAVAGDGFLFAVGDGNHSLATAKTCWDNLKPFLSDEERESHPARFALVEAVNIFDSALSFEPIHRFVKCKNTQEFLNVYKPSGDGFAYIVVGGVKKKIPFDLNIPRGIRELDGYIARFILQSGGEVDYIHGLDNLLDLTRDGGVGIILPSIQKKDLFRLVNEGGNLPKKTFSMGEGYEKRYYIEARLVEKLQK